MSPPKDPPGKGTDPRPRMVLRVLVVLAGYLGFSTVDRQDLAAGVAIWAGTILAGWAIIDRWMLPPGEIDRRKQLAGFVIGLILLSAGVFGS